MKSLVILLLILPAFALADDFQLCAKLNGAVERLDCYDQLARTRAELPIPSAPPSATTQAKLSQKKSNSEPEEQISKWSLFGLKPKKDKENEVNRIQADLTNVEYTSSGKKVFTLSNGQAWIEREPSQRKIAVGQAVIITKKKWHFELDPEKGPKVSVERVDPDRNIVRSKGWKNM